MVEIIPKTKIGKVSVVLIVLMPVLFFLGSLLANTLYKGVAAGGSIISDTLARPFLSISMLTGILCGLNAFITGLIALLKQKEKGILVFLPICIGGLLLFMLLGEFIGG